LTFCEKSRGRAANARHIRGHDLVDERFVVGAAEGGIRKLDLARARRIL
jgi:hypothetical protein